MDLEIEILEALKEKSGTGDPEIPKDILEEKFRKYGEAQLESALQSLVQKQYITYECDSAKIIKKGFDKLKENGC
ncbi:MAG: hypothetical protein ACYDG2_25265 [Ruminiclostridium sp.]